MAASHKQAKHAEKAHNTTAYFLWHVPQSSEQNNPMRASWWILFRPKEKHLQRFCGNNSLLLFFLCCLSQHLEAFDRLPLYKAKQPPAITSTQLSVLQTYLAVASLASLQPAPPLGRQQEPPDLLFPSFLGSHGIAGLCGSMGCDLGHGDGFHHVGVQVEPSESERPAASGLPRPPSPRRDLAVLRAEPYL